MSEAGPPSLRIEGAVATVRLRRPRVANRIEEADVGVLARHIESLRSSIDVRAVVLTGTGRHFSAGYDLSSILDLAPGTNPLAALVDSLEALPQTTIAAINGGVFGGAADLALACDFRYGVPSSRMFVPPARLGLHYYLSGLRRFVSRLGLDNAKRLMLLAEEIDADEMRNIGYLHKVVEPATLMDVAMATARTAAEMAPIAVSGMKAAMNAIAEGTVDAAAVGRDELRAMLSGDLREGVAAWREKRAPRFSGR